MTEAQKEYIITEEGMDDLDKYFSNHRDGLIHIAWKNLKDKYVRSAKSEAVLDEAIDRLLKMEVWNHIVEGDMVKQGEVEVMLKGLQQKER